MNKLAKAHSVSCLQSPFSFYLVTTPCENNLYHGPWHWSEECRRLSYWTGRWRYTQKWDSVVYLRSQRVPSELQDQGNQLLWGQELPFQSGQGKVDGPKDWVWKIQWDKTLKEYKKISSLREIQEQAFSWKPSGKLWVWVLVKLGLLEFCREEIKLKDLEFFPTGKPTLGQLWLSQLPWGHRWIIIYWGNP